MSRGVPRNGIGGGAIGAVVVAYMEWSEPQSQVLVVDWHVVRDATSARAYRLASAPRGASGYNSIAHAIDFAVRLVEGNGHEGTRKVIDVSGDGWPASCNRLSISSVQNAG